MLRVEEALARVLATPLLAPREDLPLARCHGRVLALDLHAPIPLPRWDNSAMDGYALRAADTLGIDGASGGCEGDSAPSEGQTLQVVDEIAAGAFPAGPIGPGQCARVFTGAPLPPGADAVVMQEDTTRLSAETVRVRVAVPVGQHRRRAGEELAQGALALPAGTILGPAAIGVAAALGQATLAVRARPRVVILSTGDELAPPGAPLGPAQIWASNGPTLAALVEEAGGAPIELGIVPDRKEAMAEALQAAFAAAPDLLLTTGGVSVGDFDVVKEALAGAGMAMDFWQIRMKPGKPLAFGTIGGVPTFGLPGNPVSALVCFLEFVRPLLRRSLGDPAPFLPVVPARFVGRLRRKAGRAELVRVRLDIDDDGLTAQVTGPQDSHLLRGAALADGLLLLAAEATHLEDGDRVYVQRLPPFARGGAAPSLRWSGRAG